MKYGTYAFDPACWTDNEAWVYFDGAWNHWDPPGDVVTEAKIMSEEDFKKSFPNVPPLPAEAFQS